MVSSKFEIKFLNTFCPDRHIMSASALIAQYLQDLEDPVRRSGAYEKLRANHLAVNVKEKENATKYGLSEGWNGARTGRSKDWIFMSLDGQKFEGAKKALQSVGLVFSQSANRYPTGVFEKLDRWFPADDVSKLNPSTDHKKRTVEALNGVITLKQVSNFCSKRRITLSKKNAVGKIAMAGGASHL